MLLGVVGVLLAIATSCNGSNRIIEMDGKRSFRLLQTNCGETVKFKIEDGVRNISSLLNFQHSGGRNDEFIRNGQLTPIATLNFGNRVSFQKNILTIRDLKPGEQGLFYFRGKDGKRKAFYLLYLYSADKPFLKT